MWTASVVHVETNVAFLVDHELLRQHDSTPLNTAKTLPELLKCVC